MVAPTRVSPVFESLTTPCITPANEQTEYKNKPTINKYLFIPTFFNFGTKVGTCNYSKISFIFVYCNIVITNNPYINTKERQTKISLRPYLLQLKGNSTISDKGFGIEYKRFVQCVLFLFK